MEQIQAFMFWYVNKYTLYTHIREKIFSCSLDTIPLG